MPDRYEVKLLRKRIHPNSDILSEYIEAGDISVSGNKIIHYNYGNIGNIPNCYPQYAYLIDNETTVDEGEYMFLHAPAQVWNNDDVMHVPKVIGCSHKLTSVPGLPTKFLIDYANLQGVGNIKVGNGLDADGNLKVTIERIIPYLEMQPIPEPIGNYIIAQKDIEYEMTNNGGYWHYSKVCVLLSRHEKEIRKSLFTETDLESAYQEGFYAAIKFNIEHLKSKLHPDIDLDEDGKEFSEFFAELMSKKNLVD